MLFDKRTKKTNVPTRTSQPALQSWILLKRLVFLVFLSNSMVSSYLKTSQSTLQSRILLKRLVCFWFFCQIAWFRIVSCEHHCFYNTFLQFPVTFVVGTLCFNLISDLLLLPDKQSQYNFICFPLVF